eukprot:TRINITY_DN17863_c0_g1_i2.p1 TRINITY_DN17863_c0_g1~~TRINITY_DN17863_c0_g1_i2.p1  ORF type:complete len:527 (+),score=130.53 TRINITY_DN17863_c0_g1_i2:168-1748(+)
MRVQLNHMEVLADLDRPQGVGKQEWEEWTDAVTTVMTTDGVPTVWQFSVLDRGAVWTVKYHAPGGSLELRLDPEDPCWSIYIDPPAKRGWLRTVLEHSVAQMQVDEAAGLLSGTWKLRLPCEQKIAIKVLGQGELVQSWQAGLGLKGKFENTQRWSKLQVTSDAMPAVDGVYQLLERCGGALGSLHKRIESSHPTTLFMLIESGRCTGSDDDGFVFAANPRRLSYGESRGSVLRADRSWRPSSESTVQEVECTAFSDWRTMEAACLDLFDKQVSAAVSIPAEPIELAMSEDGWKTAATVLRCTVPLVRHDRKVWGDVGKNPEWMLLNLRKSKSVFSQLAWFTNRLELPEELKSWSAISTQGTDSYGCDRCAPKMPVVCWKVVTVKGKDKYVPVEDACEAAHFEHALKQRPDPFKLQLRAVAGKRGNSHTGEMRIAVNALSLAHRANSSIPTNSVARAAVGTLEAAHELGFDWRVVEHNDMTTVPHFQKLSLGSNKKDKPAGQPPNFKKFPLRPEQLRSLHLSLIHI